MIPGTQETGTPQTNLDRRIEQHLLARMADYRDDQAEALRRYERSLAAFKTMKEPLEGTVPQRIRELSITMTPTPSPFF